MDELLPISVFVEYLKREANWKTLGVFLGAEPYQLNIIQQTAHNHMGRLVELHEYLDKSMDERVTLGRVCIALKRLDNHTLATELLNYKHSEAATIRQYSNGGSDQHPAYEQQSSLRSAATEPKIDFNTCNSTGLNQLQSDDDLPASSDDLVTKLKREKEQLVEENDRLKEKLKVVQGCYAPYRNTALIPQHRLGLDTEMKVKVVTRDECGEESVGVSANVRAILSCNKDSCPVVGNNRGTYHITVVPEQLGQHQLFITVNNSHIQGSPFTLNIVDQRDYTNIMNPARVITGIAKPRYIAFAANGRMYVTSCSNHCIQVFDSRDGAMINTIGSEGIGDLQFKSPKGIAIYGNTIYVAEWAGHRIQVLTTNGEFVGTIGEHGTLAKQPLRYPADVKISHDGNIYIADTSNDRVRVFKPDWTDSHTIDSKLVPDGGFVSPEVIAFDAAGNAHVTAYYSSTVVVFTPCGQPLRQYDKTHINSPAGMAIDSSGSSIVSSYSSGTLTLFDSTGEYLTTITSNDRLNHPYGVAISPIDGSLWVADADNNRLVQY